MQTKEVLGRLKEVNAAITDLSTNPIFLDVKQGTFTIVNNIDQQRCVGAAAMEAIHKTLRVHSLSIFQDAVNRLLQEQRGLITRLEYLMGGVNNYEQ